MALTNTLAGRNLGLLLLGVDHYRFVAVTKLASVFNGLDCPRGPRDCCGRINSAEAVIRRL